MADLNNNAPIDTLELDPADGKQYILELRDRMLELLSPAQSIAEVEERLKKLYPDSKLVDLAIEEAKKPRSESSSYKNHKIRNHFSSSSASFTGTLHNITSMAVAKVSNLVRDGVVGNRSENELSKYKIALIRFIINDVLKLAENFVKRQKGNFIITRSDIRTAMHADKDLLDMFLSDDKTLMITENHPILASLHSAKKESQANSASRYLTTYKQKVRSMVDAEHLFIRGLNLIIKVFKGQLKDLDYIKDDVQVLFCNIEELYELSHLLLCDLEDALESVGKEDEVVPYVGSEILDLAQAEEFHAYFTFAYKRLSRDEPWRQVYSKIVSSESIMAHLRTIDQKFDFAVRNLLPSYLLNVIVHFFEYFRNVSDLYELSKEHNNLDDQLALRETISILIKTKRAIEELLETETSHEESEQLDQKQAESVKVILQRKLDNELRHEKDTSLPFMPPPDMYRFSEPDSMENIQFQSFEESQNRAISGNDLDKNLRDAANRTPVIKRATLTKLVERLTYHKSTPDILDSFLITYRSFISEPEELMDMLIERFNVPNPPLRVVMPHSTDSLDTLPESARRTYKIYIHHFRQNYTKPVKMRVINVLKSWVKNHYYDFERHPALLKKLNMFLDEVHINEKLLRDQVVSIKRSIASKKNSCQHDEFGSMLLGEPLKILWLGAQADVPEEFDLLTLRCGPLEFARQLTLFEFDLFRAIRPYELLDYKDIPHQEEDGKKERPSSWTNLSRFNRHYTLFSYWIRKCILETADIDRRVQICERAIEIMGFLRELNNFNGFSSIGSAIRSLPIDRMSHTKERFSSGDAAKKVLADYDKLTRDYHLKELQRELKRCNPPCIPYLGSYLTAISQAKDGNKTYVDKADTSTISPTLSTDGFHSSFSNSPATPISPRTPLPRSSFMQVNSPNPPLSAASTLQNQFFGSPTSVQPKMINFHKQRLCAGLVAEICNYQNLPYSFDVQPGIRRFIESILMKMTKFAIECFVRSKQAKGEAPQTESDFSLSPSWNAMRNALDEAFWAQSCEIEPKKDSKAPPRLKRQPPEFWNSPGVKIVL